MELPPLVQARVLGEVGQRVVGINETTKLKVQHAIRVGLADGLGAAELGKLIEQSAAFDSYRAEVIARTETNRVLNVSQVTAFDHFGVQQVQAIDGDDDPICSARNGQIYDIEQAYDIHDHPNGTLDWAPLTLTQAAEASNVPPAPPVLPEATAGIPTKEAFERRMMEQWGVKQVTVQGPWTQAQFEAIDAAFAEMEAKNIAVNGLAKKVSLLNVNKPGKRGVVADFSQHTFEMRVFKYAHKATEKPWGLAETVAEDNAMRYVIQHELGHGIEAKATGLSFQWDRMYRAGNTVSDVPLIRSAIEDAQKALEELDGFIASGNGDRWIPIRDGQQRHLANLRQRLEDAQSVQREASISQYGQTNFKEDFAESMYAYVHAPEWLQANRPLRYEMLHSTFGGS